MSKKARAERIRLPDLLSEAAYDHALLSTYTFDPLFFEGEVLERYRAVRRCDSITVLLDYFEYQARLGSSSASLPKLANLQYLLHPVRAGRRFHPKVFLFAARDRGLLVVGSANLTQPGLCTNAEFVGAWKYEDDDDEDLSLFRSAFSFFEKLEELAPGRTLRSALRAMAIEAPWLVGVGPTTEIPAKLLHNLDTSLLEQVQPEGTQSDCIFALSPFLDPTPALLDRVVTTMGPREVVIVTGQGQSGMGESWLTHESVSAGRTSLLRTRHGEDTKYQTLHAKALAVGFGRRWSFLFGSANFTEAGLARSAVDGNIEAGVWITGLPTSFDARHLLDPLDAAERIEAADRSDAQESEVPAWVSRPEVMLSEAEWDEPTLTCFADIPEQLLGAPFRAALRFKDDAVVVVPLRSEDGLVLHGHVVGEALAGINDSPARVHLEALTDGAW